MEHNDKLKFIETELQELWPLWTWTDKQKKVWLNALTEFELNFAISIIGQVYASGEAKFQRQLLPIFIKKYKVQRQADYVQEYDEQETNVFIECIENEEKPARVGWQVPIYVKDMNNHDYVMRVAESMRAKFERLYLGHWITITKAEKIDDGLRGEAAQKKAHENILAGPDSLGKRWLIEYKKNKKPPKPPEGEPVRIGTIIDNNPPF